MTWINSALFHDTLACPVCVRKRGQIGDCYRNMAEAYDNASNGGRLPVPARQMYYAVRRILLALGHVVPTAHYFMNGKRSVLDQFMDDHPTETAQWDIIRDSRGTFVPPHREPDFSLSTLEVRRYLNRAIHHKTDLVWDDFSLAFPKRGPADNFGAILYIEKEGFSPVIRAAGLQEEHDLAVCSSKGYSTGAVRDLLKALWAVFQVPILVAHDFDKDGINIAAMIEEEGIPIIDIGLRWDDLIDPRWGPDGAGFDLRDLSEPVPYLTGDRDGKGKVPYDPRPHLAMRGADQDEIDFLCDVANPGVEYSGRRVELNALVGQQFVDWLRSKLIDHGVTKVVPDEDELEHAYRRALAIHHLNQNLPALRTAAEEAAVLADVPDDLATQVAEALEDDPTWTWDEVISDLVRQDSYDEDD